MNAKELGAQTAQPLAESNVSGAQRGMTKREAFAMAAMQGMLANSYSDGMQQPLSTATRHDIAEMAVSQADAMLAELAKEPTL